MIINLLYLILVDLISRISYYSSSILISKHRYYVNKHSILELVLVIAFHLILIRKNDSRVLF